MKTKKLITCLICFFVFFGNNSFAQKKTKNKGLTKFKNSSQQKQFDEAYFEAERLKALGQYELAISQYEICLNLNFSVDAIYYEIGRLYNLLEYFDKSLYYLETAIKYNSKNKWYLLLLADTYNVLGFYDKETNILKQLIDLFPSNPNYYLNLSDVYITNKEYKKAIVLLEKMEKEYGSNENIILQKKRAFLKFGEIDNAALEIKKLIAKYSDNTMYYGMLAEMYLANDLIKEAIRVYQEIITIDENEAQAHLALSHIYREQGEDSSSYKHLLSAFKIPSLSIDTKIDVLISYLRIPNPTQDLISQKYELAYTTKKAHPENPKSYAILGDIYYNEGDLIQAKKHYRTSIEFDKNQFLVLTQLLVIDLSLSDYVSLEENSQNTINLFPVQPNGYLFNGIAKILLNKNDDAIKILTNGLNYVIDNKILKSEFYAHLGDAYHNIESDLESDENYQKCLDLNPNNSLVLNNFSYYLSLRNKNLEKALEMSLESNNIQENNSSFQDTYAWILYKLQRYQEAKTWIEKAISNGGEKNAILIEHYGDILFKLEDIKNALVQWKIAAELSKSPSKGLLNKIDSENLYE